MAWKLAGSIYRGGSQEVRALLGKRVRARTAMSACRVYDPIGHKQETTDIALLAEGLVGHVPAGQFDQVLLAFPAEHGARLTSLEQAARHKIRSILVNWPTFRANFDIDL